jgi:hypothetical protein
MEPVDDHLLLRITFDESVIPEAHGLTMLKQLANTMLNWVADTSNASLSLKTISPSPTLILMDGIANLTNADLDVIYTLQLDKIMDIRSPKSFDSTTLVPIAPKKVSDKVVRFFKKAFAPCFNFEELEKEKHRSKIVKSCIMAANSPKILHDGDVGEGKYF